ncbi:MAG: RagB/SusD family nutrient uptake outer membrane protein [Hymenobacter sp.]
MKPSISRFLLAGGAALATVLGLTACKDYLDVSPVAFYTAADTFNTVGGATGAVIGAYDLLSGDATYGTRLSTYYPYDTDEMQGSPGPSDGARRSIARYSPLPVNAEVTNPWNNLYQGVERANICIKYIPQMALYNGGAAADTAALHRLHGEALTLRAQYYFELIRNWGDVPATFAPAIDTDDKNLPNADRNATYDRLLADLLLAEKLVPWRSQAGAANERITKGAVKALRARLAMYRGGYALRGTTISRPSDYLTYYRMARQECADLLARRGEHTLNTSFEETFRSINQLRPDAAHEIMFEVGMGAGTSTSDSKLGYVNGPRLNASPTYGSTQGSVVALPTYFYAFDSTDVRRDVTLTLYTIESTDQQKGVALNAVTDGKFRRDWRTPVQPGTGNYLNYNWPLIRFADVLLMFAEADNEINGSPSAAAIAAFEEVRLRGYGGVKARIGTTPTSQTGFFNAIVKERFLEFGGEGIRKYDLLRWGLLAQKLAEAKANLALLSTGAAPYTYVPLTMYYRVVSGKVQWTRSFYRRYPAGTAPAGTTAVGWSSAVTAAGIANVAADFAPNAGKELMPIPQGSLDTDRNLKQNSGY